MRNNMHTTFELSTKNVYIIVCKAGKPGYEARLMVDMVISLVPRPVRGVSHDIFLLKFDFSKIFGGEHCWFYHHLLSVAMDTSVSYTSLLRKLAMYRGVVFHLEHTRRFVSLF